MAIAYNSTQNTTQTTGTSFSTSFTNTSGDFLCVTIGSTTAVAESNVTDVAYAGVSMTKVGYYKNSGNNSKVWAYVLPAPATGANNIVVTATSSQLIQVKPLSFTGVNQSTSVDSVTSSQTASSTVTYTTTTVADNCFTVAFVWLERSPTAGTDTTFAPSYVASTNMFYSTTAKTPAGSDSLTWTQSDSTYTTGIIISIAPTASTTIKTYNGVTTANVKTVYNGTAIANRKTWNGIT